MSGVRDIGRSSGRPPHASAVAKTHSVEILPRLISAFKGRPAAPGRQSKAQLSGQSDQIIRRPHSSTFESSPISLLRHIESGGERPQSGSRQLDFAALYIAHRRSRQSCLLSQLRLRKSRQYAQVSRIRRCRIDLHNLRDWHAEKRTHLAQDIDLGNRRSVLPVMHRASANTREPGEYLDRHLASGCAQSIRVEAPHHPSTHVVASTVDPATCRHCAVPTLDFVQGVL